MLVVIRDRNRKNGNQETEGKYGEKRARSSFTYLREVVLSL